MKVGVHVSIAGGIENSVARARELGCDIFQIFTRSSRSWAVKDLNPNSVSLFRKNKIAENYSQSIVHMPYLPNFATIEEETYKKSLNALINEIERCELLDISFLVLHLGSHKGKGMKIGQKQIINTLETAISKDQKVKLLLENSAGTKNSMGSSFEDLGTIIDQLSDTSGIGICFDTCHAFAAGYDLRTEKKVQMTLEEFDKYVGIDKINVIHANDSKVDLLGKRDLHEHIGLGFIGETGFKNIIKYFPKVPYILETPIDERRNDHGNLAKIRSLAEFSS